MRWYGARSDSVPYQVDYDKRFIIVKLRFHPPVITFQLVNRVYVFSTSKRLSEG